MLSAVKLALRISTSALDNELTSLIEAALLDLNIAGVQATAQSDALVQRAVITYCKLHFGEPSNPEMLQKLYHEQKAQLMTATGYTRWTEARH